LTFNDVLMEYPDATLLKQGGQKAAYRIEHPVYGHSVLKIGTYKSPRELERIRREVATLRDIDSSYYPKNYDFQVISQDRFVIIEEYIDSRPLSKCLQEYSEPRRALAFTKELANGLNVLWQRNIVHRDVKPDNVLVVSSGEPKIIDLGIARLLDMESLTTLRGAPLTMAYAAPEQIHHHQGVIIDHRTDQFNIGIILVQLLLKGEHPFDPRVVGTGYSVPENIVSNNWHHSFLSGPSLSRIRPLATKLLGTQQFQRYRTPETLLNDINQCIERLG